MKIKKKVCLVYVKSPFGFEYIRDYESIEQFDSSFPNSVKEGYLQLSKPLEIEITLEELTQEEITTNSVNAINLLIEKEKEKVSKVINNLIQKRQELLSLTHKGVVYDNN